MTEALDRFEKLTREDATLKALGMLLWKDRYRNPEMSVQITEEDMVSLNRCAEYLKIEPQVRIFRPQGRPAQPFQPATAKRSAIPETQAEGPKPFIMVQLVDKTGDAFVPIESTEEGADIRDEHNAIRKHKNNARQLADQLMADLGSGAYSDATIREAAQALAVFAKS